MEEKIFGDTAPSQQIEKTPHWTEFLSLGTGLTLEIDCPVEWGEEDVYPVNQYTLAPFTAEKIVQLSHLFFGKITGLREQEVSYEELVAKLLRLEQGMYEGLDEEGNPYTLLEVANENVALLSFEEVQNRVRTYMQLGFAQGVSDASRITIQRVVLTSTLVHVREDLETGYRVPVWAIFYLSDLDEKMGYPQSVLLINALDGSLVR